MRVSPETVGEEYLYGWGHRRLLSEPLFFVLPRLLHLNLCLVSRSALLDYQPRSKLASVTPSHPLETIATHTPTTTMASLLRVRRYSFWRRLASLPSV
jgi:hypothetical protein